MRTEIGNEKGPLAGLRVIDASSLFAGPVIGTLMGDFGADVVKIEHPRGDSLRTLGWQKNDVSLWWAFVSRNKRMVTLDLSKSEGSRVFKELAETADVIIEGFRPGTLEGWGIGPEVLHELNPGLVIVRVSGFGQTGPQSSKPGFGTVAESISGFAHINGFPDGPPILPPFALGDGVAALFGTFAAMFSLYHRDVSGGSGQIVDLSLYEPLFWLLGPQALAFDQLGVVAGRHGSSSEWTAPRNTYQAADGTWLGLSASAQSIAERLMILIGHPEIVDEPWFADHDGRVANKDLLDSLIAEWIEARPADEVLEKFAEAGAVIGPIYSIADIFEDAQYQARETITTVDDPRLGPVRLQNVIPLLSATPGSVRYLGGELGEHNSEIFCDELGHSPEELEVWSNAGVV